MEQIHIDRLRETTAYMLAHPEQHDQTKWHCGTSHCWAGFGDLLEAQRQGKPLNEDIGLTFIDSDYYGLSEQVWWTITGKYNTREAIVLFVDAAIAGNGVDINLKGKDLSSLNLYGVDLDWANLAQSNLSNSCLIHASLSGADLTGANLTGADLTNAELCDAILIGADLTNANLTNAFLVDADLTGANLTGANLTGARLS